MFIMPSVSSFVYNGNLDVVKPVEKVVVCSSHRGHYDLVLTRRNHANLGYSQTFVYDLLYFNVFGFLRDVIKNCIKRLRGDMSKGNHPEGEVGMSVEHTSTTLAQEETCGDGAVLLNNDDLPVSFY
uniref:Ubiquitinyl hydrolase 1 n=1 Tax=Angiostrongylus cantonensis TaxID=6313 RepID=A0A0K0DMU1_ANGCA